MLYAARIRIKWDMSVRGRNFYLLETTLGPQQSRKFQCQSLGGVVTPQFCQALTIDHMLHGPLTTCAVLYQSHDKYHTADFSRTLFVAWLKTCVVEFLRETGFLYLVWLIKQSIPFLIWIQSHLMQSWTWINPQNQAILSDLLICP